MVLPMILLPLMSMVLNPVKMYPTTRHVPREREAVCTDVRRATVAVITSRQYLCPRSNRVAVVIVSTFQSCSRSRSIFHSRSRSIITFLRSIILFHCPTPLHSIVAVFVFVQFFSRSSVRRSRSSSIIIVSYYCHWYCSIYYIYTLPGQAITFPLIQHPPYTPFRNLPSRTPMHAARISHPHTQIHRLFDAFSSRPLLPDLAFSDSSCMFDAWMGT